MKELVYRILYEFMPVALSVLVPEFQDQPTADQVEVSNTKLLPLLYGLLPR